jgi:hypothetical protein
MTGAIAVDQRYVLWDVDIVEGANELLSDLGMNGMSTDATRPFPTSSFGGSCHSEQ